MKKTLLALVMGLAATTGCGDNLEGTLDAPEDDLIGAILGVEGSQLGTAWYGELREGYNVLVVRPGEPCDLTPVDGPILSLVIGFCADSVDPGAYDVASKDEFCAKDSTGVIAFVEAGNGVDVAVGEAGRVDVAGLDSDRLVVNMDIDFEIHEGVSPNGGRAGELSGVFSSHRCEEVTRTNFK